MKKIFSLTAIAFFSFACTTQLSTDPKLPRKIQSEIYSTEASSAQPIEIQSMTKVFELTESLVKKTKPEEILIVFDIDNTLLTASQDFGSYAWGVWQAQLISEASPDAIAQNHSELYRIQNNLFFLGVMKPTEDFIPTEIAKLQKRGVSVIALSSRGPQMRSATERDFKRNGLDFRKQALGLGFPEKYFPNRGDNKELISFQEGIYLTNGLHKGHMLRDLLDRSSKSFDVIIFVDDHPKHPTSVLEAFAGARTKIYSFRYRHMDEQLERVLNGDQKELHQKWKRLHDAWIAAFPENSLTE